MKKITRLYILRLQNNFIKQKICSGKLTFHARLFIEAYLRTEESSQLPMLQYTKKTDKAYKDRRLSALDLYYQIFVQLCAPSRFVHPRDGRARDLAMEKGT
jgi:hypothetical protein